MTHRSRLWIGSTLLIILAFNYAMLVLPLIKRSASIEEKSKAILINQVKTGKVLKDTEDDYILEIFKREKSSLDKKVTVLNIASVTILIIIASWTVFGLIFHKR